MFISKLKLQLNKIALVFDGKIDFFFISKVQVLGAYLFIEISLPGKKVYTLLKRYHLNVIGRINVDGVYLQRSKIKLQLI